MSFGGAWVSVRKQWHLKAVVSDCTLHQSNEKWQFSSQWLTAWRVLKKGTRYLEMRVTNYSRYLSSAEANMWLQKSEFPKSSECLWKLQSFWCEKRGFCNFGGYFLDLSNSGLLRPHISSWFSPPSLIDICNPVRNWSLHSQHGQEG